MKRSATSTPSKTKKSKVAVAKRSYKRFYPVPRPLGQYSSGFPKQLAMTHRYSQNVQYTHVGPNANSQYANFGTNCLFDDDLTPAITTLDGMVEQPSAVLKTSAGRRGGHYLQELGC